MQNKGATTIVPVYRDHKILWFGIPLLTLIITLTGTYHSLEEIFGSPVILFKLCFNSAFVGLAWWAIKTIVLYFDRKRPWNKDSNVKRWRIQIGLSIISTSIIFLGYLLIRGEFIEEWQFQANTVWATDLPLAIILALLINFIYYYLWTRQHNKENDIEQKNQYLKVSKGKKTSMIGVQDIAYAYRLHEVNYLVNLAGDRYLLDGSLNNLEQQLTTKDFFRLNRQLLAHRKAIQSFQTLSNSHLEVELTPSLEGNLLINKNKAAQFKQWFEQSS